MHALCTSAGRLIPTLHVKRRRSQIADVLTTGSLKTYLSYPFLSRDWFNRFLVGTVLLFACFIIPLLPAIFVYGYFVRILRRAIHGEPLTLPDWSNAGELFTDGLRSLGIGAIYLGPGSIVTVGGWLAYFLLWFSFVEAIDKSGPGRPPPEQTIWLMFGAFGILLLSMALGWLLTRAGSLPLPVALAHFAARDKFSAAFDVWGWGAILRADPWGFAVCWVVAFGLAGVMYMVYMVIYFTVVLCFLAYFILTPMMFYIMAVSAAMFGQFYREALAHQPHTAPDSSSEIH